MRLWSCDAHVTEVERERATLSKEHVYRLTIAGFARVLPQKIAA